MMGTRINDSVSNVVDSTAGLFLEDGHLKLKQASQTFYADGVESIETLKKRKVVGFVFQCLQWLQERYCGALQTYWLRQRPVMSGFATSEIGLIPSWQTLYRSR